MKDKTITVEESHVKKLNAMGYTFGQENPNTGAVNHSGLIRNLIDRAYAQYEVDEMEVNCPQCDQWTYDPRSYLPAKCPYCGSPLEFVEVNKDES